MTKSTGSWYAVLSDSHVYNCRTRGKLRLSGFKTTNPIAVGDRVIFEEEGDTEGAITEILPRENYIIRQAIKKSTEAHILAANLGQVLLIATMTYPKTSPGFIDRFLVSAESFRIPQLLVFNKQDLLSDKDLRKQDELISIYNELGIKSFRVSAANGTGLEELKKHLDNNITLFSGHSGVGKSTVLNKLSASINQPTKSVSDFAQKGVHTTTFAEMFQINDTAFVIDTPGIKELGLIDIDPEELSDFFPEMREIQNDCKFHNCSHIHEPGCVVQDAVNEGTISESRYRNYLSMYYGDDNRK